MGLGYWEDSNTNMFFFALLFEFMGLVVFPKLYRSGPVYVLKEIRASPCPKRDQGQSM